MRSFKHWTPRYICNRLIYAIYVKLHPDHPWLTATSIQILDSWLKSGDIGFEWGCGRSTLWFAKRVSHLTSIEHNENWFCKIDEQIKTNKIKNVDLFLKNRTGEKNSEYVQAIKATADISLDFVLVDGRLRKSCIDAAVNKIKPGGFLILDNSERYIPSQSLAPGAKYYPVNEDASNIQNKLKEWRIIKTSNGIWDTVIWIKPSKSLT